MDIDDVITVLDVFRETLNLSITIRQLARLAGLPYSTTLLIVNYLIKKEVLKEKTFGRARVISLGESIVTAGFLSLAESIQQKDKRAYINRINAYARLIE